MEYTFNEYSDMLLCLGAEDNVATAAAREYARRFPGRRHPDAKVIRRVEARLRETGQVMPIHINRGRQRTVRTAAFEEEVLESVENNREISIRALARGFGVGYRTVQKLLSDEHYHPYHYTQVQGLLPQDYAPRVRFCEWLLERHDNDPDFIGNILWTDESYFGRDAVFNYHNNHVYATENPLAIRRRAHQQRFGVNLWAGVNSANIIGPFILPERLDAEAFLHFLQHDFQNLLEDVPLAVMRRMWFQMDGAPAHYGRHVRAWCDEEFFNRWIGRGGAVAWPPRSPDLTPCDFFLWGHLKNLVYKTAVNNRHELIQRIEAAVATIDNDMLHRVQDNIVRRAALCIEVGGDNFEHLL